MISSQNNLPEPATAAACYGKVVEVDPVTVDRSGRTVAFVKVGDTVVNEELIRQGLAGTGDRGASGQAGTVVYAERHTAVGFPEN